MVSPWIKDTALQVERREHQIKILREDLAVGPMFFCGCWAWDVVHGPSFWGSQVPFRMGINGGIYVFFPYFLEITRIVKFTGYHIKSHGYTAILVWLHTVFGKNDNTGISPFAGPQAINPYRGFSSLLFIVLPLKQKTS